MVGLAAVAHPLVILLLKEQWSFTAKLLQVICFSMMWFPIHSINLNLLQVKGRSDLFLKLEIYKKFIGIAIICITVPMGLIAMCIGSIFSSIICLVINTHYTGKLIKVGFLRQMKDLMPTLLYSLSMGLLVYVVIQNIHDLLIQLLVGVTIGIIYYIGITWLTKSQDFRELIALIRDSK